MEPVVNDSGRGPVAGHGVARPVAIVAGGGGKAPVAGHGAARPVAVYHPCAAQAGQCIRNC